MKKHLNTLFVTTQGAYLAKDGETVAVRIDGELVSTTPGRIIIREIAPVEVPFEVYNREMSKKVIGRLVGEAYRLAGLAICHVPVADPVRNVSVEPGSGSAREAADRVLRQLNVVP